MAHTSIASRLYHDIGAMFTPVLTSSRFVDEGVLTPEEFVAAGDLLIRVSPLWKWCAGDEGKRQSFLPPDKQYLSLKGVSCLQRVSALESEFRRGAVLEDETEDGWVTACEAPDSARGEDEEARVFPIEEGAPSDLTSLIREDYALSPTAEAEAEAAAASAAGPAPVKEPSEEEFLDLETFAGEDVAADEATIAPPAASGEFVSRRKYDVSIVYDRKYRTPRVYLFGFDEDSHVLSREQVMEDVMSDYANKTVTVEPHPHEPGLPVHLSIHPCRHAAAMTRIVSSLLDAGLSREDVAGRVELYLLYFLKFVQSVIPTIDYDATIDVHVSVKKRSD
jgi:ubiquitin-like-conjugating enzyme ATG3